MLAKKYSSVVVFDTLADTLRLESACTTIINLLQYTEDQCTVSPQYRDIAEYMGF